MPDPKDHGASEAYKRMAEQFPTSPYPTMQRDKPDQAAEIERLEAELEHEQRARQEAVEGLATQQAQLAKMRAALEDCRQFIADEYRSTSAEEHGEWLTPEARPIHKLLCNALATDAGKAAADVLAAACDYVDTEQDAVLGASNSGELAKRLEATAAMKSKSRALYEAVRAYRKEHDPMAERDQEIQDIVNHPRASWKGRKMAEHDPVDVEYMARLLCVAHGEDANSIHHESGHPFMRWEQYTDEAKRALDYLQSRGEKVTTHGLGGSWKKT